MSLSQTWDSQEPQSLELPYNRIERELSDKERLIRGNNSYVTVGGKLVKRPGTLEVLNTVSTNRIARLWRYETLENPPKVFILASVFNPATSRYQMMYVRLDAGSPAWTSFGTLRNIDVSTSPHVLTIFRGKAYVKGFPTAGDKLGSVVFDGSGASPTVRPWGLIGPTVPAALVGAVNRLNGAINASTTSITTQFTAAAQGFPAPSFTIQIDYEQMTVTSVGGGTNWTVTRAVNGTAAATHDDDATIIWRDWSASDHIVVVNIGWKYSYAWKTITGQYSNRASLETNPDKKPSISGPFFDQIPKFTVQGHADTTNVPTIAILRSEDGGGRFYILEEITNTGAGNITYSDDSLESAPAGGTFNDPVPDSELNQGTSSPSEVSNDPPPSVIAPEVVGVDEPEPSTPLVTYQGRIWFGIGNILFYSGQEEIDAGIPEECFPGGSLNPNLFRFPNQLINLVATNDALYVFTLDATYKVTGTNRETFSFKPLFDNVGAPYGHQRAITRFNDTVALLTHDFRVVLINDESVETISDPLYTDLIDAVNDSGELDITYFGDLDKEWLVVTSHNNADPTESRQWVYDIKISEKRREPFWNTPWTIKSTAMLSGRIFESQSQRRLVFFIWSPSGATGRLVRIDPTLRTGSDINATGTATSFDFDIVTHLYRVPAGNHINTLRVPSVVPSVYNLVVERSQFSGTEFMPDSDPFVYYFKDDFWTDPISTQPVEDESRIEPPKAYRTLTYPINEVSKRFAVEIRQISSQNLLEIQNWIITFKPNMGTGGG